MDSRRLQIQQRSAAGLIIIFLVMIWLPLGRTLFFPSSAAHLWEQGQTESVPALRWSRRVLNAFPARFEEYYSKRFGFRGTLICWQNILKVRWLKVSSSANVLVGKNGWLYYNPGKGPHTTGPFSSEQLLQWQHVLEARRDWLAERGVPYLLVITPDKQTIYPEHLPRGMSPNPASIRQDQLLAHLREHSDLAVLDLRKPLLAAKSTERIYYRTDSHWNKRGAFIGYQQIVSALNARFPQLQPLPRSAFEPTVSDRTGGDLACMLGLGTQMHEEELALRPLVPRQARVTDEKVPIMEKYRLAHIETVAMTCPQSSPVRAVMMHDSFGIFLKPYLAEHFARIVYLPTDILDPVIFERERPDIVIQQMVERKLTELVPLNVPEMDGSSLAHR
jgi:hypothetical protein